jgi:hypothetical protein
MSRLRPELATTAKPPTATNGTAYYVVLGAVEGQDGLIHGRLHERGQHCAIGSYFADHPNAVLREDFIDEVAAVNDSVPYATPKQRKKFVLRWLRWRLTQLGFPNFRTHTKPEAR